MALSAPIVCEGITSSPSFSLPQSLNEWCIKVKPGQTVEWAFGENTYLHLSKAFFKNIKEKGNEGIELFLKCGGRKVYLGNLSAKHDTQILRAHVLFQKDLELSISSMSTDVYFSGYMRGELIRIMEVQLEIETFSEGNVPFTKLKVEICDKRPSEAPSRNRKAKMISLVSSPERGKLAVNKVQGKGKRAKDAFPFSNFVDNIDAKGTLGQNLDKSSCSMANKRTGKLAVNKVKRAKDVFSFSNFLLVLLLNLLKKQCGS